MKKYFLLLLLAMSQFLFAEYRPMLVEGREWTYRDAHGSHAETFKLSQTTIVNGQTYWDFGQYALREDVEEQTVYLILKGKDDFSQDESVLFTFDCKAGDVFKVLRGSFEQHALVDCTVASVETIDDRKHIKVRLDMSEFDDGNYRTYNEEWVEEIGEPLRAGVMDAAFSYPINGITGSWVYPLVCVSDGNSLIYSSPFKGLGCEGQTAEYKPILVEGREWNYLDANSGTVGRIYKADRTIIVNGLEYWDFGYYALREDAEKQTIYRINKVDGVFSSEETVFLTFDCKFNDIIKVCAYVDNKIVQADAIISSVETFGGRKRIKVSLDLAGTSYWSGNNPYNVDEVWIEGIGNIERAGVERFYLINLTGVGSLPLICVHDDDKIIYENVINGHGCDGLGTALDEIPADELLTISGNVLMLKGAVEGVTAEVFAADGRQVMSFSGATADISALPSGLYVIRTTASDGKTITAKFVR